MKSLILSIALGLWCGTAFAQTIRIANNNPDAPTGNQVYPTLQAALDAAQSGDIIHVIGSPTNYGNATVRKPLSIIGIGFEPDKDIPVHSAVGSLSLETGTGTNASGTSIEGLVLTSILQLHQGINNIFISKCFFDHTEINENSSVPRSNIHITDNIFRRNGTLIDLNVAGNADIIIRNNIFILGSISVNNALVANNVFTSAIQNQAVTNSSHSIFANNIFFRMRPLPVDGSVSYSIFSHNLAVGSADDTLPTPDQPVDTNTGQNNINNAILAPQIIDPVNFFVNYPETGDNDWDGTYDLSLHPDNPGVEAGSDGTDLGAFGGEDPFNNVVGLPIIQRLNTAASIKEGDNLPADIQVQAN